MKTIMLRVLRKLVSIAYSTAIATTACTALHSISATPAHAQAFFSTIVTDPAVGVDRGSASQIQKLDERTFFLTFDTYGSSEIGPNIAGLGYVWPDAFSSGDQLDIVGAFAGPSDAGGLELLAGGIGYRFPLGDRRTYLFARADHGEIELGTPATLAISAKGHRTNVAFGLRRTVELEKSAKLTTTLEVAGHHGAAEILNSPIVEEHLRLVRASLLYEQGFPLLFQRRFALAVTKGLEAFGASAAANPRASIPGASSDFLRASFSAEASVPLSQKFVANVGVIGQWSEERLPLSQRCGYGTNAYARGFDQSYVNGDRCLGARTELAYNVELPDRSAAKLLFTQAYLGVDYGWIEENTSNGSAGSSDNWSSGSIGVRTLRGNFIGEVSFTRIFDQPSGPTQQDQSRLWVRAGVKF